MGLTEEEKAQFLLQFLLLDQDSDGRVSVADVGSLLRAMGHYPTQTEVRSLTSLIDPEQSGTVSRECMLEALETLHTQKTTVEEVREAFKVLDEDADGYLTTAELRHILVNLGARLTKEEADEVIADAEADADKHINIDDLISLLMNQSLGL